MCAIISTASVTLSLSLHVPSNAFMNLRMTYSIFIDGAAGTTGLQVADRLARHPGVTALALDDEERKDNAARQNMMATSDLTILCLPDAAARTAADMAAQTSARLIDASSAHRTHANWVYGFVELITGQRDAVAKATRISNPGCYPTGFLALTRPLIDAGILPREALLSVSAVSGFSGGGKSMIARQADCELPTYGSYSVTLAHKHIPEMMAHAGLSTAPIFMPAVANFYSGMLVNLPLHAAQLSQSVTGQDLHDCLAEHFAGPGLVRMAAAKANDEGLLVDNLVAADGLATADHMELSVFANQDDSQFWLLARFDNLGKGASGAAVQNMNIALGLDEMMGLTSGA